MKDGNFAFYKGMKLESFMEFARLTGFTAGVDIDVIYPYIKDAKKLVELGAGYGRAIDFLLKKGFEGEIVAVERIDSLIGHLENRFGTKVSRYICEDITELRLEESANAIVWLWSGILELTVPNQSKSIKQLYECLAPGGLLALESPHKQVKIVGKQQDNDRHIQLRTDWGELNAYLPTREELYDYAKEAGFEKVETVYYQSDTGLERVFYLMRKGE